MKTIICFFVGLMSSYNNMVSFSPPPTTNEVEQVGVQTPSTAPRAINRLQQPLQQYPFTPQTNESTQQLSKHQLNEIKTIFQLFDPSLSGYVDIPTFEIMLHSLGYRMTQSDIICILDDILSDEDTNHRQGASTASTRIDLQLAIQILVTKGYTTNRSNSSIEDEIQSYFQLFDCNNKGYGITLNDLKRVYKEVAENNSDDGSINDEMLQSMINQFDTTHNGVIGYDEFKTILKPVLSHHMD